MLLSMIIMVSVEGQNSRKKILYFAVNCITLYSAGYCIEICGSTVEWVFAAYKIQYIGISFLPAFLILLHYHIQKKAVISKNTNSTHFYHPCNYLYYSIY
jgi:hypothetical protein